MPLVSNDTPSPVATAPGPRTTATSPRHAPPKSDALGNQHFLQKPKSRSSSRPSTSPPAVVRGQASPPPAFDFEESLSAANVTSVVNQFRSYPPPIRHLTSPAPPSHPPQMAIPHPNTHRPLISPQKPGSSSSLSSNSHHTDATRRTNRSYGTSTSASSLAPAPEVCPPLLSVTLGTFSLHLGHTISGPSLPGHRCR